MERAPRMLSPGPSILTEGLGDPYPASNHACKSFAFFPSLIDYVVRISRTGLKPVLLKFEMEKRGSE
jgi:hypothetical protein